MTEEMMLMLIGHSRNVLVSLYLGGSGGQEIDVHRVSPVIHTAKGT